MPEAADEADVRLLAAVEPTRSLLDNVHLEHVLRAASLTGRSPADVASRLTALGYRLPDEVEYPEVRGAG
ncbi:wHTH domain-containing protein [Streptomyces sp. NBC_01429]|uniref:wHTH domain-containing protein n=1 Tax=Streptomyces sp. NBC_01429 TaxID=2903862 RepID=UPI003FCE0D8F